MVKIFSPYKTVQFISGNVIELELPTWRQNFCFIFYRIFPFILAGLVIVALSMAANELPQALSYSLGIGVFIICIMLWFRKFITEIKLDKSQIIISRNTLFGNDIAEIKWNEITQLTCLVRHGKGGGAYFYLYNNDNHKIEFITIPLLSMKEKNTKAIIAEIEILSKINVEMVQTIYT